jgi:hypothetical protein
MQSRGEMRFGHETEAPKASFGAEILSYSFRRRAPTATLQQKPQITASLWSINYVSEARPINPHTRSVRQVAEAQEESFYGSQWSSLTLHT